nr:MAG: acetyltransferase, GNAT, family [Candidatus Nanosalinarum sp. J07AB56]
MTYRVGYEGGAEQFREKIGALLRASADDFTVSLMDRNKSFEAVVDSFVAGKDIVAARKSGEIAGFVLFTRGGVRSPIKRFCPCVYVNLTLVDRGHRNQGIARRMYRRVFEDVLPESGYDCVGVRTHAPNEESRSSITSAGFVRKATDTEAGQKLIYYVYQS